VAVGLITQCRWQLGKQHFLLGRSVAPLVSVGRGGGAVWMTCMSRMTFPSIILFVPTLSCVAGRLMRVMRVMHVG
jgi:hypothetical protein